MYLKRICATGFKSFADKTQLDIKKGITSIVGPNGSGKSNVVDAVRWVLGEQSVKALRGASTMSDVIFVGSKTRPALSRASVALTFDNQDHYLNSEFNEIEIKRVVYKTGENEYYINNVKVRLKDITDLFIDSGAGKESFNIISQGSVSDIVSSKPEDRRIIFEEAAGVLKYKKRKEETLRKLQRTNENLERVNLLINELATSLEPLEKQSTTAKKYLDYKKELENIEVALIAADIKRINDEYQSLKAHADEIKKTLEEMDISNNKDIAKLEMLKLSNIKIDEEINKNTDILLSTERQIADLQAKKQLATERKKYEVTDDKLENNIIHLRENELNYKKNITTLTQELEILTKNLQEKRNEKEEIDNNLLKISRDKITHNNEFNLKTKDIMAIKNRIDIITDNIANDTKLPFPVKSVLNNPRLKGIHQTILKLIDVKEEYLNAIQTSLGANGNVIVVNDESSAKNAVLYLKENNLGRATFFPLNIIKPRNIDELTMNRLKNITGFIDVASNLVSYDKTYDSIIKNQLGNIIVAKDLDSLNKIGKLIDYRYKIVTLDGDVQYSGGAITGGSIKNTTNSLSEKYELTTLTKKEATLTAEINLLTNDIKKLEFDEENLTIKSNNLNKEIIENTEIINRKNISLNDLNNEHQAILDEISGTMNVKSNTLDDELEKLMADYYEQTTKKDLITNQLNNLKSRKFDITNQVAEIENTYHRYNSQINKLQQDLKTTEITLGKMDVKLDNYLLTLNEDYNMTYEKAINITDINIDIDSSRLQVNKLKSQIKELGDVNLGSIDEFERINTRYTFLSAQKQDLADSVSSLLNIIDEMDEIMKSKFVESFKNISKEFKLVFKTLFKGGEGRLELTNPDNILETGIDIIAEPPGKKLTSINLLSGGEMTLTAIAVLFAILNVKPVPFVILDEVEAALDEANVDVFGKYLQSKKDKSQFIIITHKKRTMEYADTLYGITMQEQGISKLVSVKLSD